MKDKLLQSGNVVSMIINDNGANLLRNSHYLMTKLINTFNPTFIAVIKHDKDLDEEVNQLKTEHYHVVMELYSCMILRSYLGIISEHLNINENQISIEKCTDIVMATQYLIHQNNLDKYQYNQLDIESNDYHTLYSYLKKVVRINTTEDAISVYDRFHGNFREIIKNLSRKVYKDWRLFFNDLERYDSKKWR